MEHQHPFGALCVSWINEKHILGHHQTVTKTQMFIQKQIRLPFEL